MEVHRDTWKIAGSGANHTITKDMEVESLVRMSEVICINCKHRYVIGRAIEVKLKMLECPKCGLYGYVIETGEQLNNVTWPNEQKELS